MRLDPMKWAYPSNTYPSDIQDNPDTLFRHHDLRQILEKQEQKAYAEIDEQNAPYLLNVSTEDYADHLADKFSIENLRLYEAAIVADLEEAPVDACSDPNRLVIDKNRSEKVTGVRITYSIPFTGDPRLFKHCSVVFIGGGPHGKVEGSELHLSYTRPDHDIEAVKSLHERNLSQINNALSESERLVNRFNDDLRAKVVQRIEARKRKLFADQNMAASLGVPLRRRDDAPETYAVPNVRRNLAIQRPAATTTPYAPEPTLALTEYENILRIISSMSQVLERSPRDFRSMGEEALRQHFLIQLNGQYEGSATGETFNGSGKTDILIRGEDGKNLFIAECKFWKGKEQFLATIDQLLSYVTWRDTKTAVLMFNRNKSFTDVLTTMEKSVPTHPNYKRRLDYAHESGFRYVFHHPNDQNREVFVTVLAFEVPA